METKANELIYESVSITDEGNILTSSSGLTKREYFAAMAMQGFLSNQEATNQSYLKDILVASVKAADYLIAELNKRGE